jgi:hypothetical protein
LTSYRAAVSFNWLIPSTWGNRVVFKKSGDLYLINIESGEQRALVEDTLGEFADPQIWEDIVVWGQYSDIYWCRLPDCEPRPATTNWAAQDSPTVGGEWIAWCDLRNDMNPLCPDCSAHDNIEIWGKNIRTGDEVQLVSIGSIVNNHLKIDGGMVFFLTFALKDELSTCAVFMKELPSL